MARRMLAERAGGGWGINGDFWSGDEAGPCRGIRRGRREGRGSGVGSAALATIPKVAALAVLLLVVAAPWIPGAQATCDTSCKCINPDIENQDPVVYGQTCIDQGPCGNAPCTGGSGCPSSAPASITAMVTGDSTLGIYWEDPTDDTMVDQYNIFFSMTEAISSCNSLSVGDTCSFTLPEESFARTGVCGLYDGGSTKYCWIDLAIQIAAVPPCDQQAPAVQGGCNWANLASGVVVGRQGLPPCLPPCRCFSNRRILKSKHSRLTNTWVVSRPDHWFTLCLAADRSMCPWYFAQTLFLSNQCRSLLLRSIPLHPRMYRLHGPGSELKVPPQP